VLNSAQPQPICCH